MLGFFGQVWALCLISFLIGVLLNSLLNSALINRPLRRRIKELQTRLAVIQEPVADPVPMVGEASWPDEPAVSVDHDLPQSEEPAAVWQSPEQPEFFEQTPPPIPNPSPNEMAAFARPSVEPNAPYAAEQPKHGAWESNPPVRKPRINAIDMELSDPPSQEPDPSPAEITGPISAERIRRAEREARERRQLEQNNERHDAW